MRLRTHRPRYYVACGVLLLGGAIAVSIFLRVQGPPKTEPQNPVTPRAFLRNPGPPPPPLPEFVAAEKELKTLDEVGSRLMKLLADEKRPQDVWQHPLENRHEAARWLGELRYLPAIPMLIQYIDTKGPSYDDGATFPCREALEMFGDAAVPRLVDAFLEFKGPGQTREHCLWMAIAKKSQSVARIYAKGRAAENPDMKFQKRVEYFLDNIKPDVPR